MYRLPYCQGNKILCTSIMALLRELFTLHQALGNLVSDGAWFANLGGKIRLKLALIK